MVNRVNDILRIDEFDVLRDKINGATIMHALGERESMGTTAQGEDIWRGNDLTPSPTSHTSIPLPPDGGEQMTVVSESANDDSAGTGVQAVRIHYLDATGNEQSEDVTMDGTNGVNTVATDIRFVQDLHAIAVGSNGVAEGHIKIHAQSDAGLVYNMIALGGNKSLVPARMVPSGKTLFLMEWHAEEAQDKRCVFRIRSTDMNELLPGVFCFKGTTYIKKTASGLIPALAKVPALSIVKISAWPDVSGSDGSCGWWGYLVVDDD